MRPGHRPRKTDSMLDREFTSTRPRAIDRRRENPPRHDLFTAVGCEPTAEACESGRGRGNPRIPRRDGSSTRFPPVVKFSSWSQFSRSDVGRPASAVVNRRTCSINMASWACATPRREIKVAGSREPRSGWWIVSACAASRSGAIASGGTSCRRRDTLVVEPAARVRAWTASAYPMPFEPMRRLIRGFWWRGSADPMRPAAPMN